MTPNERTKQLRRERAKPGDPLRLIPDSVLHDAIERTIAVSGGKLYLTDVFVTIFGSLRRTEYRNVSIRQSINRRAHIYLKKYPKLLHTRYTVIWDVSNGS